MASGEPTQDAPGLNTTRQMLDELDALMERMLALPINETEEAAPAPSTIPPPTAPTAPLSAKLTLLRVPVEDPPLDPPHASTNASHLPTLNAVRSIEARPAPTLPPLPQAPPVTPAPLPTPLSDRVVPAPPQPSLDTLAAEVPELPEEFASWFILALLWGNRAFDRGTLLLGDGGAWLRTRAGRALLGAAGLLLLAAAVSWLARDWFGWSW